MQKRTIIIAGCLYSGLVVIALDVLTNGANLRNHVSDYANGPYHYAVASAFFVLALCSIFLAWELYKHHREALEVRIGSALLALWGVLILLAGVLNTDVSGQATLHGLVHDHSANSAFLLVALSVLLISMYMKKAKLLWLAFIAMASYLALYEFARGTSAVGLVQRIFLLSIILSLIFISKSLKRQK